MKHTENTLKALSLLENTTNMKVKVLSLSDFGKKIWDSKIPKLASYFFTGKEHVIGIDNLIENESSFVHECLHGVLGFEGYPGVYIDSKNISDKTQYIACKELGGSLASVIQHKEVYRRMISEFNLNIDKYFDNLVKIKTNRLRILKTKNPLEQIFFYQQNIIDGIEYFWYPKRHKAKILNVFEKESKISYNIISKKHKDIFLFDTPSNSLENGNDLLLEVKKIGIFYNAEILNTVYWNNLIIQ